VTARAGNAAGERPQKSEAAALRIDPCQLSSRGARASKPASFLAQTKALALNHQGVTVVKPAIEDRRGEDVVTEDGAPCVTS
jgi:hypothetical protein